MATIMVGSARHDENGKYVNGMVGDALQKSSTNDTTGEVSMQKMYTHSKGWYILRPSKVEHAEVLAKAMITACNNANIGYDQNGRYGVIKYGIDTTTKTEADCSSLVRACIIKALRVDVGDFSTINEADVLEKSNLFEKRVKYVSQAKTPVYNGDVLVTCTKGHTVIVVSGNPRGKSTNTSTEKPNTSTNTSTTKFNVGDTVMFTGSLHYVTTYAKSTAKGCKGGLATITNIFKGQAHPYHLKAVAGKGATVHGWVNAEDISPVTENTGKTYVVKAGDTLSKIAKKYNTTVDKLVSLNSIPNKDDIRAGQIIKLP